MSVPSERQVIEAPSVTWRIFAALELSKSAWVVAVNSPNVDKVSLHRLAGGDFEGLMRVLERAQERAGGAVQISTCYEAGYDGFWIHRALTARGIDNTV